MNFEKPPQEKETKTIEVETSELTWPSYAFGKKRVEVPVEKKEGGDKEGILKKLRKEILGL